jgi:hypothetical protein
MSRERRLLFTLAIVLGLHLIAVWLIVSSPLRTIKAESGSLLLFSIAKPSSLPTSRPIPPASMNTAIRHRSDRVPAPSSVTPPPKEQDDVIHPAPDWTEELQLAAKNAVANELARKLHERDFAHVFPIEPKKAQEFAWNYAAIHRVEALPEGAMLIHLGDHCVLVLMPLPIVGCGIGNQPANGNLFEHLHN